MSKRDNDGPTGSSPPAKTSILDHLLETQSVEANATLPVVASFPSGSSGSKAVVPDPMVQQLQSLLELQQKQMEQNQIMMQAVLQSLAVSNAANATSQAKAEVPAATPMDEGNVLAETSKPVEVINVKPMQIPSILINHIKTVAKQQKSQLDSLKKTEDRLLKLQSNREQLASGKVPHGLPPFKMPFKAKYVEEKCFEAEDKLTFEFSFAAGESYVQCKHRLYVEYLAMQNEVDIRLSKFTKSELMKTVTLKEFLKNCKEPLIKHRNAVGEVCLFLGEEVQYDGEVEKLLDAEASRVFGGILNSVAATHLKSQEEKLRLVELDRLQRETAAKLSPGVVLESYIGSIIDKRSKGKKTGPETNLDFGAMIKLEVTDPVYEDGNVDKAESRTLQKSQLDALKKYKHELKSKNGKSPVTAGGSNRPQSPAHPSPKAKAKGKANGGSKGSSAGEKKAEKGKGKGKSSKGKGKGKGNK